MRAGHRLLLAALLCAASPALAASGIEGYWYGEGYQPFARVSMEWLMHRRSDGSFEIEFRRYESCKLVFRDLESGHWSLAGDIETDVTERVEGHKVDSSNPFYRDAYRIEWLTGREMRYRHLKTGQVWTTHRVGADFTFPDCPPMS